MKYVAIIVLNLIVVASVLHAQPSPDKYFRKVLLTGKIDSSFIWNKSTKENGHNETIIKYLGLVTTIDGRKFKILTYENIWGPNYHTSGTIYIYNDINQYLGNYYVAGEADLPEKLRNNTLIFVKRRNSNCTPGKTTRISFRKGLPKLIFIKCEGKFGDLYSFSVND